MHIYLVKCFLLFFLFSLHSDNLGDRNFFFFNSEVEQYMFLVFIVIIFTSIIMIIIFSVENRTVNKLSFLHEELPYVLFEILDGRFSFPYI